MEAHVSKSPTVNPYGLLPSATGNLKEGPLVQILMRGARQPSSRKPLIIFVMQPNQRERLTGLHICKLHFYFCITATWPKPGLYSEVISRQLNCIRRYIQGPDSSRISLGSRGVHQVIRVIPDMKLNNKLGMEFIKYLNANEVWDIFCATYEVI